MSKEITKAIILQEIQDKFKLREFAPSKFLFDETVVPIYDVGQHLTQMWNKYKETSITAIGNYVLFTVPSDEKWHLSRYDIVFMGAGAYTVAGLNIKRINRSPDAAYVYIDLTAAQTVSYHVELAQPLKLMPGDQLKVSVDGYTATQDLRLYIDYEMEEIR